MSDSPPHERSGCGTFIFWCLPSVFVPLIMFCFMQAIPVGIAVSMICIFWNGHAWAKSFNHWDENNPQKYSKRHWGKVAIFTLSQIVIIPVLLCSVVFGFCTLIGIPKLH